MEMVGYALSALMVVLVVDQMARSAERRGWIYYRKRKGTGGLGPGLEEFNRFLSPTTKHIVEAKQTQSARRSKKDNGSGTPT